MSTTGPVFVVDYTDMPYEDVCAALASFEGQALGAIDHIGDHVARVAVFARGGLHTVPIAELRVIAVSTGRDALTEVLAFAAVEGDSPDDHALAVTRARSILAGVMHHLEMTSHLVAPRRAS